MRANDCLVTEWHSTYDRAGSVIPGPADEAPHAPVADAGWSDVWQLDAATADGVGLTVRLECFPNEKVAWFWTYLVLPARPGPVVVRDHEVFLPRRVSRYTPKGCGPSCGARHLSSTGRTGWKRSRSGSMMPPMHSRARSVERMPLGLDLEWEIDGPVHAHAEDSPVAGYCVPGIVHGEILLGRERLEFDARGEHRRQWGTDVPRTVGAWSVACHGTSFAMHVDGLLRRFAHGRVEGFVDRMGDERHAVTGGRREGGATAARLVLDHDLEIAVEVLTGAPVPLAGAIVDRALCRFQYGDEVGHGWSEVVEPR